jgi:hypothetical protein
MSHIYSHQQTTTPVAVAVTVASLADARRLANKERRKVGREVRISIRTHPSPHADTSSSPTQRHEERKEELKAHEFDRKWVRHERDAHRQEKRREDGTHAFIGRNTYNHRKAGALHVRATDIITTTTTTPADVHHPEDDDDSEDAYAYAYDYDTAAAAAAEAEEEAAVRFAEATSGAMLLAMARPAKTRTRRRRHPPVVTDGEMFEIVEIDGRLVALDEDGWEILPDENAEVSLLYSDIVRGSAL